MKIGVVGGGQLGRMLAQAGSRMGHAFKFLAPPGECCVEALGEVVQGDLLDQRVLKRFAAGVDVFTFEWENVPQATLEALSRFAPMRPSPGCAAVTKDRLREKKCFQDAGLNVQRFAKVARHGDIAHALEHVGLPAMMKTCGQGYDGKGQRRIQESEQAAIAHGQLGGVDCILEEFVAFDFELSLIAVRSHNSSSTANPHSTATTLFYPPCRNQHINGILHLTTAPAEGVSPVELRQAQDAISKMMETMDYEGVLCVEFFVVNTPQGQRWIANEMAPRVHNSGHWTIEGALTSQFTNHINAITRAELGSTASRSKSAMINLVGMIPGNVQLLHDASEDPLVSQSVTPSSAKGAPGDRGDRVVMRKNNVAIHIYGKAPRAGRKLGHITAVGENALETAQGAFNSR